MYNLFSGVHFDSLNYCNDLLTYQLSICDYFVWFSNTICNHKKEIVNFEINNLIGLRISVHIICS